MFPTHIGKNLHVYIYERLQLNTRDDYKFLFKRPILWLSVDAVIMETGGGKLRESHFSIGHH